MANPSTMRTIPQLEQQNRIAANRLEKDNNSFTLEEDGRNVTYI